MFTTRKLLIVLAAGALLATLGVGFQLAGAKPPSQNNPDEINLGYRLNVANPAMDSPDYRYTIQAGSIAGGNYRLTTPCQESNHETSGGGYRLLNLTSGPWGNCCCTYLPIVKRH